MNKSVKQKMDEMLEVFNRLPNCKIETNAEGRILIASKKPVPWSDSLEKSDAESLYKIGVITPHKSSLGLYIDFPHNYLDADRVEDIINPEGTLTYYPPGIKASNVKSWWRLRSEENFDSIHMVLRKIELDMYDFKREEWIQLMEEIIDVHE